MELMCILFFFASCEPLQTLKLNGCVHQLMQITGALPSLRKTKLFKAAVMHFIIKNYKSITYMRMCRSNGGFLAY
jgi:hypothetical protein